MLETPKNKNDQTLIDQQIRADILKQIMMLKSWIAENLTVTLRTFEYQYVSKALLDEAGVPYTNRDFFAHRLNVTKVGLPMSISYNPDSTVPGPPKLRLGVPYLTYIVFCSKDFYP
jgi:hypothetical protein